MHLQKMARPPIGSQAIMRRSWSGTLGLPSLITRNCAAEVRVSC